MEEIKNLFKTSTSENPGKKPKVSDSKPKEKRRRSSKSGSPVQLADASLADPNKLSQLAILSEQVIHRNGIGQYLAWLKSTNSHESIALYQKISTKVLEALPTESSIKSAKQADATKEKEELSSEEAVEASPETEKTEAPQPDLLNRINRNPSSFHQEQLIPVLEIIRSIEVPKKAAATSEIKADSSESETPEKPRRIIVESNNSEAFAGAKTDA